VALSGAMWLYGEADRAPLRIPAPQFYLQGGLQGAMGTMMAHYHRELSGEGQYVDQSCQQAMILTVMWAPETWDFYRVNLRGQGPGRMLHRPTPHGPLFNKMIFRCKDGHVMALAARLGGAAVEWANEEGYMLELKDFDWASLDLRTATQEDADHRADLLEEFLMTRTKAECLERAVEHSIMLVPVSDVRDVLESPQMAYRGFFKEVEHPELGEPITYPAFPAVMNGARPSIRRRAPLIGEHNEEVYEKELGISKEQLVILKNRGVI